MLISRSSMAVMLLCYFVDFTNSFPSYFIKPSIPFNDFIKHYEPAFYDAEHVTNQHKRIRRATTDNAKIGEPLKLTITTTNKVFKLLLKPDQFLFANDVIFEGENGRTVPFDTAKAYIGTLEDDERSTVRGIITEDGFFDGTVSTQSEDFYIEPISRYKPKADGTRTHTIMYRISDVAQPNSPLCASSDIHAMLRKPSDLNTIAHRSKRAASPDHDWPQFVNFFKRDQTYHPFRYVPTFHDHQQMNKNTKNTADNIYYDLDLASVTGNGGVRKQDDDRRSLELDDENRAATNDSVRYGGKTWRPKSGVIDTVYKYTNVTKSSKGYLPPSGVLYKSNSKILIGNGMEESRANLIITNDDSLEQHARKRAIVDPKKTTCMLYLQADHLFFEKYGTEETCIEVMTRHVQRVNSIYRNTDFNQDGKPDNISFMIKRIKVHSAKDPSYRFPGNYGVEKFLEIFSEEDYDAFCLAYMFTYRDFEMGTLGLAWTGDLKNAGGVCEKNGHYRGSLKSLNTGIVTVLNYGKHVPSAVSHVTLAHEIGHNFGSPHDPDGCTPGGDDGNFIMFARATSGDKKNNNKFSPCSLNAINPVLNVKARSSKGCFTEPQTSICGNGVVEPGEECDCGWEEDCKDHCCFPQRRYPPLDEQPCRLTPNAVCSPSQGPCCTAECAIKSGDMCRSDNGCRDSSYCNGISPQCPPSTNKPNKTVCHEEYVCYMGECTGSICLAYGLESCQCIPSLSDAPTKACELCCKLPGENQPCLSSFQWNQAPYDVPDMFAKPGTPCNDYNGYCDVFRKCREVDPSGPIATLRKLLLSEENIASFKKWAYDHWYYCTLIFLAFVLFMIISTKILGKKPKVKSVTVVHSSPTEPVRLPTDGSGGPAVVVHPIAVRTKLPLKKKVRENKRRSKSNRNEETATSHNVNNNNSPIETAKQKKRGSVDVKGLAKNKTKTSKNANQSQNKIAANATGAEDPLGKVRNWLINSHNLDGLNSLKKSKSSPASFDLSDENCVKRRQKNTSNEARETETKKMQDKKSKENRVKLQVVYRPPFKFSVKLGKNKNEISSHLIKDKRPEAVKQRAALLIRADRIRANGNATKNAKTDADKVEFRNKSKNNAIANADGDERVNVTETEDGKTKKIEYKRSMSAPQPEPLYENTIFETAASFRNDQKLRTEEPHYANISPDKRCQNEATSSQNPFADGNKHSENVVTRTGANDVRNSFSKCSNERVKSTAKRRNSYDRRNAFSADIAENSPECGAVRVKRQYSDDTDTVSAAVRSASGEFKPKQKIVKRTRSVDNKPAVCRTQASKSANARKSYHDRGSAGPGVSTKQLRDAESHNLISFASPTFTKSSKRKNSFDTSQLDSTGDNATAVYDGTKISCVNKTNTGNCSGKHIKRSTSNGGQRKENGHLKRNSLQIETTNSSFADTNRKSVPISTNEELAGIQIQNPPYEVLSDLEVLLSENENVAEG